MNSYREHMIQTGITKKVRQRYYLTAQKYENWLDDQQIQITQISTKQFIDYLQHVKYSRQLSRSTVQTIHSRLKHYHQYLSMTYGWPDPTLHIDLQGSYQYKIKNLLSSEQIDQICDLYYQYIIDYKPSNKELRFYPDHDKLRQGKYLALTMTAYQAMTQVEIIRLQADDLDLHQGKILIQQHRRAKKRTLPLAPCQIAACMQYFARSDQPIIPNFNHMERLSREIKKIYTKFENLRQLRASRISHWIDTHGLRRAQVMAGHRQIISTESFRTDDQKALKSQLNKYHPIQ